MQRYPMHISAALASMGPPDDEEAEIYLLAFIAAWESYDLPNLLRALQEGEEFDRLFALWALAAMHTPEARDALLLLLESTHPLERWASALALAKEYHDERALPMLGRMLSEMLPPSTDKHQLALLDMEYHASDYYFLWRREIPDLLGDWGDAASVPALRAALQAALRVELALDDLMRLHDESVDGILGSRHDWTDFEDQVVYALGRLGGFGALAGIAGAETPLNRVEGTVHAGSAQSHLEQWRIHLIMGSLHGQYMVKWPMLWRWEQTPDLLRAVTAQLEHVFGLAPAEYMPALDRYAVEMGATLVNTYQWRYEEASASDPK